MQLQKGLKSAGMAVLSLLSLPLFSQDIHFSQFYASPLTLNPANTGRLLCNWRATAIYRDQWRTIAPPIVTASASFDKTFSIKNEKIGGGAVLIYDRSGDGLLNVSKIYISGAYHRDFGKHTLSGGLQLGFVDKRFDKTRLTFPMQWDDVQGQFNGALDHPDMNMNENLRYFDMNAGAMWSVKLNKVEPNIGVGFFHITKPRESFYDRQDRLPARFALHSGLLWDATERFFVHPNFLYQFHSTSREFMLGSNFGYHLSSDKLSDIKIWAGPMFRHGLVGFKDDPNPASNRTDAVIAIVGVGFKSIDVGFAYDINISDLKRATKNMGAFEISLIYKACPPKLDKEQIPCDRL